MTSHRAQILKERLITAITADGAIKNTECVLAISARTSLIPWIRQQSSRIKGVKKCPVAQITFAPKVNFTIKGRGPLKFTFAIRATESCLKIFLQRLT